MKGMTTQDTFDGQNKAPEYAISLYCFIRISGTARNIPATYGKMGRNGILITTNQKKNYIPQQYHALVSMQTGFRKQNLQLFHPNRKNIFLSSTLCRIHQQNHIITRLQGMPYMPVCFPAKPSRTVPFHCVSKMPCKGKSNPVIRQSILHHKQLRTETGNTFSPLKYFPYLISAL
jgi:hypothetical protein